MHKLKIAIYITIGKSFHLITLAYKLKIAIYITIGKSFHLITLACSLVIYGTHFFGYAFPFYVTFLNKATIIKDIHVL